MSQMDINGVLAQIRSLQAQAATSARPAPIKPDEAASKTGFAEAMKNAVGEVSATQNEAARLQTSFAMGDRDTDLSTVMLASAKAQVQFRAMTEVRNRLVAAYQDIMNMPL